MIAGLLVRNFKTYRGINYIPLSIGSNYCGLIGENGVGKSSVLEAFDCFFNNKPWNKNVDASKSGNSYVMLVFVIKKDQFDFQATEFVEQYSNAIIEYISRDIPSTINQQRRLVWEAIKDQFKDFDLTDRYLIILGLDNNREIDLGIFDSDIQESIYSVICQSLDAQSLMSTEERKKVIPESIKEKLHEIFLCILEQATYVYIPRDIEPERFVKFETDEIQRLLGANLIDLVKQHLSEDEIRDISDKLRDFVDGFSDKLPNYTFKTNQERQPKLRSKDIYNLIVHDFFSKRELFKSNPGKDIPLAQLSSGEKQQAIITLIHSSVVNYRNDNKNLIIAIDEPESALHISSCFEQFQKLFQISERCDQVFFSSHWYGFIPTITDGCITNIVNHDGKHSISLFNIFNYREGIRLGIQKSKGNLSIDITLKGINDLIQSIISSVINDSFFNWLICEGSSDKIYMEEYLKEEITNRRLRIVPVCGIGEVEKVYHNLEVAFHDLKGNIKGSVFLLTDTDSQFHGFDTKTIPHLCCKKIVNDEKKQETKLVDNSSNLIFPTDIEDALNGKAFNATLLRFKEQYPNELSFISGAECDESSSYFSLNLRPTEKAKLDDFFSKDNNLNKTIFAKSYVNEIASGSYNIPSWINEIKEFFQESD